MTDYGKLILSKADGVNHEYTLNKPLITLGRATTNDIVLLDGRVSRNHAEIYCTEDGLTVRDLDSANGIWKDQTRVKEAKVNPQETFDVSGNTLQYFPPVLDTQEEATIINTESELEQTLHQLTVPVSLNETSLPRLVIHAPDRTWEILLVDEAYSIGRSEGNQITLDYPKISRNHAQIERRSERFILRDLQSTNGTLVRGAKIDQHSLQNGDMIQVGPVRLVYKSGFTSDDLTVVGKLDLSALKGLPPVIFVPGTMGSQLWLGNERVWPNINLLLKEPSIYRYSEQDTRLKPRGILNEMVIVPNLVSIDQYNIMGDYLVEELGYEREKNFIEFAYDWRQDVRQSARELAAFVETWKVNEPITLIAHSLGTLVSRYYVEKLGGKKRIGRLILMGGPHQGVPKIVANLLTGVDLLPFGLMGKRLTEIIETFPSCYQILPLYPCGIDQFGKPIHFLEDESWVKPEYRPLWRAAREFRRDLGMKSSVPTLSIFGYGIKTAAQLLIQTGANGTYQKVTIDVKPSGDSSVPESSAVLPRTEIHPVRQHHGTLFGDNDVRMRLKLELLQNQLAGR